MLGLMQHVQHVYSSDSISTQRNRCGTGYGDSTTNREDTIMENVLALEFVRVTEAGAVAAARWMGQGDNDRADQAAVEAMRRTMDEIPIHGTIVIGEGERDE